MIAVICDGCSWGKAPQIAAKQAKNGFIEFLDANTDLLTDTNGAGHALLLALRHAHESIIKGRDPTFMGTTTLLGQLP